MRLPPPPWRGGDDSRSVSTLESIIMDWPDWKCGGASCAALAKFPDRDTELLGLVGKIRRDARAWEDDDPDREDVENPVVALERGGSGVTGPVRLEDDLRHLAGVGPAGGD